jgi:hypothetical protein
VGEDETDQVEGGELMPDHAPSYAPSIAQPMLRALPDAMHATNATNATHVRNQDSGEIVAVPDAPTPVDNPKMDRRKVLRYTASDLEFAAFLASRSKTDVSKERYVPRVRETLAKKYDEETAEKLAFIHGVQRRDEANRVAA